MFVSCYAVVLSHLTCPELWVPPYLETHVCGTSPDMPLYYINGSQLAKMKKSIPDMSLP